MRVIEHAPVKGAPQVPVGGVEDPHADTVSQPTDIYFLCLMIVEDDRIRVGQRKNRCPTREMSMPVKREMSGGDGAGGDQGVMTRPSSTR